MEDRKKHSLSHRLAPDVFCGEIREAVGQYNYVKRVEKAVSHGKLEDFMEVVKNYTEEVRTLRNELLIRDQEIQRLRDSIQEIISNNSKERAHLYQVVLSLKKEWEAIK
ncbi:hypothetical protein [Brevibacillus sp. SYSU BS000544]|uniref:hypothetical protein n=1 Tax=Brevibacillus sp. SYSU BS000544 TaxID=3416443 RepID=UPI003CE58942